MLADTPSPPYYAVIFTSQKSDDSKGYDDMAKKMASLAAEQAGFLGLESSGGEPSITVSYWTDLESIKKWKANSAHREAQEKGRGVWYVNYKIRISKVEREYAQ